MAPRALTIATSDSGGGAGIQADLKAFAAAGCHGMSALVALTAQNTTAVTDVFTLPPDFVRAELDAVFGDIGVDAAKTGMLFSRELIVTVADYLTEHPVPLVVDPVMVASSGAKLLRDDAVEVLIDQLFPLATVVTPNLHEARELASRRSQVAQSHKGFEGPGVRAEPGARDGLAVRKELAEQIHSSGARAVIVTGGHGDVAVDLLFDGDRHVEIPVARHSVRATHGAGCTHSATLAAHLARGESLEAAARAAAAAASEAVQHGLVDLGAGEGPVDVLHLRELG